MGEGKSQRILVHKDKGARVRYIVLYLCTNYLSKTHLKFSEIHQISLCFSSGTACTLRNVLWGISLKLVISIGLSIVR